MRTPIDKERTSHAKVRTLMSPEALLRGFLFVCKALLYFSIFAELVLLAFVLKAIV